MDKVNFEAVEESLQILKCDLVKVETKLSQFDVSKSTLNPDVQKLIEWYAYLKEQIKQAEDILNAER